MNKRNLIRRTEEFINDEIGFHLELFECAEIPGVFDFTYDGLHPMQTEIAGDKCYFIFDIDRICTPGRAIKIIDIIRKSSHKNAFYVIDGNDTYEYQRGFRRNHLDIIVPERVIYCPSLFISARTLPKKEPARIDKMPAVAQAILIRHILYNNVNGKTTQNIAIEFNITYGTVQKSFKWLCDNGYAHKDRERLVLFKKTADNIENTISHMENPISKTIYVWDRLEGKPVCGDHAMDRYTMLAASGPKERACTRKEVRGLEIMPDETGTPACIFKYDPKWTIQNDDCIDPISLYLTMKDNDDERVQKETEKLLKKIIRNGTRIK